MSRIANSQGAIILIVGDLLAYFFSLILTLAVRYGEFPSRQLLVTHLPAFSILFLAFLLINFSAGLYDRHAVFIRGKIVGLLIQVQIVDVIIGALFFYFAPVTIAPKANLFIYFVLSTLLLAVWRMIMYPVVTTTKREVAIAVGNTEDLQDLYNEINTGMRYGLVFKELVVPRDTVNETVAAIREAVERTGAKIVIANLHNPAIEAAMPFLYSQIFAGVQIVDAAKLYESVFERIPLSMVRERWLVENSSTALGNRRGYDRIKRLIDILIAVVGGAISLIFYPFVYIAIKIEDRGPLFITQKRTGMNGKVITIIKFRSMSGNDDGNYGASGATKFHVTRVGRFLRNSRIDELPQFWNVLKGDLSLVGPRPELPNLVAIYEKEIQYYNARHLVKPGLCGWAQLYHESHPHHTIATEDSREKLSYDLYYMKHRSLTLDMKIIMRTVQILANRTGR